MNGGEHTALRQLAQEAAEAAKRAGADAADAYLTRGKRMSIDVYEGKPELYESAGVAGAGIRAWRDSRLGYAYTTDLSPAGLVAAAELAYRNAAASDRDPNSGLPDKTASETGAVGLGLVSADFAKPSIADKIDFALRIEQAALAADRRVTACESVSYGEEDEMVALANTNGFAGVYERQICYAYADAMAVENGETQTGFSYGTGRHLGELDADFTGREAAERAAVMLGGRQAETATLTAVFDPLVFVQVMAAISPALSAESAQKGRSFLAAETGKRVASDIFTLVDDGRLPGGMGTAPFDDEGSATGETTVINAGILSTLLFNAYSASVSGGASTGNARRGSFRAVPGTSPTNMFVRPGELSRDDIVSTIDDGIYVMGLQGLHAGVSPITGQFSAGAYGLRIKSGHLAEPIREVTIASTCAAILKNVSAVGSDLRFVPLGASLGAPTIAIDNIVLSGR